MSRFSHRERLSVDGAPELVEEVDLEDVVVDAAIGFGVDGLAPQQGP